MMSRHIESAIACSLSLSVCLLVNGKQSYFAQSLRIILAGASFNFFQHFTFLLSAFFLAGFEGGFS